MWGFGMGVGKGCTVNKSFERLDLGLEKVGEGRGGEGAGLCGDALGSWRGSLRAFDEGFWLVLWEWLII